MSQSPSASLLARVLFLFVVLALIALFVFAPPLRLLRPPLAPLTPVTIITITPPPEPPTLAPVTHVPSRTRTYTPTALPRTATNTPTTMPTATATATATALTLSPSVTPATRVTLPTTGGDFSTPFDDISFPFTLAEFLAYLAGGILTYPACKFIFEKLDEANLNLTSQQKRFLAYPIAALVAVGAAVLLHYLGYAPLTADGLYKAFGTAFLTAQALHGWFDMKPATLSAAQAEASK